VARPGCTCTAMAALSPAAHRLLRWLTLQVRNWDVMLFPVVMQSTAYCGYLSVASTCSKGHAPPSCCDQ
jgi:hypothetical protein